MENRLLYLAKTLSPLHAGIGQVMGVVDLPIEREKHTNYPCVYASGMKGALRAHCEHRLKWDKGEIAEVFGKEDAAAGAGGVIFTDLKILLFPVRSSEGSFKWVTCDLVLSRFIRDLKISQNFEGKFEFPKLTPKEQQADISIKNGDILLEDFIFSRDNLTPQNVAFLDAIDVNPKDVYKVDDEHFCYLVTHATQIIAHNVLDENKISTNLWYEETLPADTILYSFLMPSIATNGTSMNYLEKMLNDQQIIQIGGGETVGHGITSLSLFKEV